MGNLLTCFTWVMMKNTRESASTPTSTPTPVVHPTMQPETATKGDEKTSVTHLPTRPKCPLKDAKRHQCEKKQKKSTCPCYNCTLIAHQHKMGSLNDYIRIEIGVKGKEYADVYYYDEQHLLTKAVICDLLDQHGLLFTTTGVKPPPGYLRHAKWVHRDAVKPSQNDRKKESFTCPLEMCRDRTNSCHCRCRTCEGYSKECGCCKTCCKKEGECVCVSHP